MERISAERQPVNPLRAACIHSEHSSHEGSTMLATAKEGPTTALCMTPKSTRSANVSEVPSKYVLVKSSSSSHCSASSEIGESLEYLADIHCEIYGTKEEWRCSQSLPAL
jgi:hypothetical protein